MTRRRPRFGRFAVYVEPRDAWIGVYMAPAAVRCGPVVPCLIRVLVMCSPTGSAVWSPGPGRRAAMRW